MSELFAICSTYEIDDGGARGFVLARLDESGAAKPWPIIVTRKSNSFFGFENACPHQGKRLDTVPGEFLDEEGNFLTCGVHHAQFDLDSGQCFIGPCQGKASDTRDAGDRRRRRLPRGRSAGGRGRARSGRARHLSRGDDHQRLMARSAVRDSIPLDGDDLAAVDGEGKATGLEG